jgi:hypothetical protein
MFVFLVLFHDKGPAEILAPAGELLLSVTSTTCTNRIRHDDYAFCLLPRPMFQRRQRLLKSTYWHNGRSWQRGKKAPRSLWAKNRTGEWIIPWLHFLFNLYMHYTRFTPYFKQLEDIFLASTVVFCLRDSLCFLRVFDMYVNVWCGSLQIVPHWPLISAERIALRLVHL